MMVSSEFLRPGPDTDGCTHVVSSLGDDIAFGLRRRLKGYIHAFAIDLSVSGKFSRHRNIQFLETHEPGMDGIQATLAAM